jgi:hypothetical protein
MALLDDVIDASGGLTRWNGLSRFTLHLKLRGSLLSQADLAGHFEDVIAEGSTRTPSVRFTGITDEQRCGSFRPEIVTIESLDGEVLRAWHNPSLRDCRRASSSADDDEIHLVFLCGLAIWTSLATPFLLANPDFTVNELTPWQENGDQWRRLRVQIPQNTIADASEFVFYFDNKGHQRRMDHDLLGSQVADYSWAHQTFNGIVVPTLRRSQLIGVRGIIANQPALLNVEIFDAAFE